MLNSSEYSPRPTFTRLTVSILGHQCTICCGGLQVFRSWGHVSIQMYEKLGYHWTLTLLGCISLILTVWKLEHAIRKRRRFARSEVMSEEGRTWTSWAGSSTRWLSGLPWGVGTRIGMIFFIIFEKQYGGCNRHGPIPMHLLNAIALSVLCCHT